MRKKWILIVGIILLILVGGVKNSKELNEMSIVSSIAIDITPEGNYKVSALIMDTSKGTEKGSDKQSEKENTVYEYTDVTIQSALRNMIKQSPKKLQISHIELLIVSEELARKGIWDCLDFFMRENESSKEFFMTVARDGTAQEVLKVKGKEGQDIIKDITGSLKETKKYQGASTDDLLSDNIAAIIEEGNELVISSVKVEEEKTQEGEDKKTNKVVNISDMAYFKEDQLKGYLEETENIAYTFLRNRIQYCILQTEMEEQTIAFEILKSKTKLNPEINNEEYTMNIQIDCEARVTEVKNEKKLSQNYDYEKVKQSICNKISQIIQELVTKCQTTYQTDILEYGKMFHKKQNKAYEQIKECFEQEYFPKIKTNITVKPKLKSEQGVIIGW